MKPEPQPINHSPWAAVLALVFMFGVSMAVSAGIEANRLNPSTRTLRLM